MRSVNLCPFPRFYSAAHRATPRQTPTRVACRVGFVFFVVVLCSVQKKTVCVGRSFRTRSSQYFDFFFFIDYNFVFLTKPDVNNAFVRTKTACISNNVRRSERNYVNNIRTSGLFDNIGHDKPRK